MGNVKLVANVLCDFIWVVFLGSPPNRPMRMSPHQHTILFAFPPNNLLTPARDVDITAPFFSFLVPG